MVDANPPTIVVVCDESGAKGYASTPERCQGEFGCAAGILLPSTEVESVRAAARSIVTRFGVHGDKVHITEMAPAVQAQVRDAVIEYIKMRRIPCVYEAIYVDGIHQQYAWERDVDQLAKASAKEAGMALPVHGQVDMLLVRLLVGVCATTIEFGHECYENGFSVRALLDRINEPILEKCRREIEVLLGPLSSTEVIPVFNRGARRREDMRLDVKFTPEPSDSVRDVTCQLDSQTNYIVLFADVLANSIAHHLKDVASSSAALVCPAAIRGHSLAQCFYFSLLDSGLSYADTVYMHSIERMRRGLT